MPEGLDQNLMGEPADKSLGNFSADENFKPGGGNPEEVADTPEQEPEPDFKPVRNEQDTNTETQSRLNAQQQAAAATSLAGSKQRQLLQIARERNEAEKELGGLEKNLIKFKNSKSGGLLSIFRPRIKQLIDNLLEDLKKGAKNLSDEQKVRYYTGLLVTATTIIGILKGVKMFFAVLDATLSWLTKAIPSCITCIGCIFFMIVAPIYIPILALIVMLGAIPLLKGKGTKMIADMIDTLKKQRVAWDAELMKFEKKVTLRKQIQNLNKFEKEVKKWK